MTPLVHEYVDRCSTCQEATPHSRRWVAIPLVVAVLLAGTAGWLCWLGGARAGAGVLLGMVALWLPLKDRERYWRIRCERCRWKQRRALRATKPGLGRGTVFADWF